MHERVHQRECKSLSYLGMDRECEREREREREREPSETEYEKERERKKEKEVKEERTYLSNGLRGCINFFQKSRLLAPTSVTRFGEIATLWQNFKSLWAFFCTVYLIFDKLLYQLWHFYAIGHKSSLL